MSNAAVAVANAGNTFAHGTTEGTRFTFIGESWFEWAFAGDGLGRRAFAGNWAAHGRRFIASKIFHAATVVGRVTGCRGETKVRGGLAYE